MRRRRQEEEGNALFGRIFEETHNDAVSATKSSSCALRHVFEQNGATRPMWPVAYLGPEESADWKRLLHLCLKVFFFFFFSLSLRSHLPSADSNTNST